MTAEKIKNSISYCGLLCCFCSVDYACDCRTNNSCAKALSDEGCFQYTCCRTKNYNGCWECPDFSSCNEDMFDENI